MNTEILQILNNDDELYNRVYAYGPGDGINRMMVMVENTTSIAAYGLREVTLDVPMAVSYSDLETKANEYLATASQPTQDIRLVYHFYAGESTENITYGGEIVTYNGEPVQWGDFADAVPLKRGDTIRVVSEDLGTAFTGEIAELSWSVGSVDITMGTTPYNLLDVINGPEEDEEREKTALGLPVPIGLRASRISPGISISVNPYANSRAVGVEIYASTVTPVGSTRDKLLYKGPGTSFDFRDLESGVLYYFKARSYDGSGEVSGFTEEVSEIAGFIDGGTIEEGTLDITPFASALRPPRNVVNLPVVSSFGGGWLEGDYVVYDGELYKLVSATGDPNTDWVAADYQTLEGDTIARQIVAGQITAGAIGADQIAANAITADKIAAGTLSLEKIGGGGANVLANPGFETGDLTGWSLVSGTVPWEVVQDAPRSGSYHAKLVGTGASQSRLRSEPFPVYGGAEVYMSLWARGLGGGIGADVSAYVWWFDTSGNGISSDYLFTQSVTGSYAPYYGTSVTAPANAVTARLYVQSSFLNPGTMYVDDIYGEVSTDASRTRILAGTSRADGSGFSTSDGNGNLQTKMGYLYDDQSVKLPGVPAGTNFGFWGTLGTGVFIQGAPRVVSAGTAYSTDENGVSQRSGTIISSSLTVPTGYRAYFLFSDISYARDTPASGTYFSGVPYGQIVFKDTQLYWDSSSTLVHSLGPGTYPNLRVRNTSFQDPSASPQSTSGYLYHRYTYMILMVED